MAVYVKNRKGTYGLSKEEFRNYMYNLWQRAQARKQAREDMQKEREENRKKWKARGGEIRPVHILFIISHRYNGKDLLQKYELVKK